MTTKENILIQALHLFSTKGYQATTVIDIANAVQIKAPSLYKHFKSKEDILRQIHQLLIQHYQDYTASLHFDGINPQNDLSTYQAITNEQLTHLVIQIFTYISKNQLATQFRKLLTLQQYQSPFAANLLSQYYYQEPLAYQSALFIAMKPHLDSQQLAIQFYSPIYLQLLEVDRNPQHFETAIDILKQHITSFYQQWIEK